jgi:hypothetical protein
LRNLVLQLAQNGVFDARWSELAETSGFTIWKHARIAAITLPLIRTWFADAIVVGFDPARVIGDSNPTDRHVASADGTSSPLAP